MDATQQRAVGEPLRGLRAALDDERHTAAIGAAKDLLEATCKVLLARAGQPASGAPSLPTLFKEAHRAYALDATEPASDLGRSLAAAVQRLAELRNAAGAGHGHAAPPALEARDARLAAATAAAAAAFLLTNLDLVTGPTA